MMKSHSPKTYVNGLLLTAVLALFALPVTSAEISDQLPDPDGKPADMSKKVKVFILMGQSNMLGAGQVAGDKEGTLEHAVKKEDRYPFLVDDDGNWTERKDVRNAFVMQGRGGMQVKNNDWLAAKGGKIGPEIGIGHYLGNFYDEPVLILKACIGNRALGWDLLPPGSESYEFTDSEGVTWVHPGYKGSPQRWKKGETAEPIGWYAGKQYDDDTRNAKTALDDLEKFYPGATGYEVVGFLWWQGDRDSRGEAHASRYEQNLVQLIKSLRKDFNAPEAKFVTASLGQTEKGATDNGGKILNAMFAITDAQKYPDLKGDVAAVYTHPLSMGGSSGGHYNGNAKTYMNVGLAMGSAMVELLKEEK